MKRIIALVIVTIMVVFPNFLYASENEQNNKENFEVEMQILREDLRICVDLVTAGTIVDDVVDDKRNWMFNTLQCPEVVERYAQIRAGRSEAFHIKGPGKIPLSK